MSTTPPEAEATGLLVQKPLAQLLAYAFHKKLHGTFVLTTATRETVRIAVADGFITRVATSEPVAYLGQVLYERGLVSDKQLNETLAELARTRKLHGEILVSRKMLTPAQLEEGLRWQRLSKVHHAFSLPSDTAFDFHAGVDLVGARPGDIAPMSPLPSIWRGLTSYPPWEHVTGALASVASRELRLVGDVDRVNLDQQVLAVAESLRHSPCTVGEFVAKQRLASRGSELLAFFLVSTRLATLDGARGEGAVSQRTHGSGEHPTPVSFRIPAGLQGRGKVKKVAVPPSVPPPSAPGLPRVGATPAPPSRQTLAFPGTSLKPPAVPAIAMPSMSSRPPPSITTSFAPPQSPVPARAASSVPPASVRSPSVSGGLGRPISSPAPSSSTRPPARDLRAEMPEPPRKVNLAAEQSLSQAHMHLALDERDQALAMARKALAEEPGFPAAAILAAYLASAGETNPRELRALLSMIDKALGREPSCRRGYFYRSEVRKRLGDHKGAVEDLRTAMRNDPDDNDAARELRVYERKIEAGTLKLDGEAEAPKSIRFLDRLRGK